MLISEGRHTSEDLPPLFGLSMPVGGPVDIHGQTVWLMGGLGSEPEVAAMVLDLIRAAAAMPAEAIVRPWPR